MSGTIDRASIIPSVSEALRMFIGSNVPLVSEGTVTFDSPADWEGTKQNSVSLYLYNIEINPYLRNLPEVAGSREGEGGQLVTQISIPAPLVLDLTYMVVAYGSSGESEQLIANGLANLLDTCGRIPEVHISSSLKRTGNELLSVIPEVSSIHELRDLWAVFSPKSYHLTRLYKVPAVHIPLDQEAVVDVVAQTRIGVQPSQGVRESDPVHNNGSAAH